MAPVEIKTLTGAEILVETLKNIGTECIFGYPGGIILGVYDKLSKTPEIKHYLMRHEQSAAHAAEGYSRVTGKCGVVLVTSGPGATNTVTGIANAYLDGYPMIVISGQVEQNLIGKNAFQEVDFLSITKSCTKAVFQIKNTNDLEETIINAHQIAMSGKKGPVVIDIPKDIFSSKTFFNNKIFVKEEFPTPSFTEIDDVINMLLSAKRPLIVSGGGVVHSKSSDLLAKIAETLNIPVVVTMMGIGTYSTNSDNYVGMIGLYGSETANEIFKKSDVVLALGARFNDRITSAFSDEVFNSKKIVQVDINKEELSRNINPYIAINAELRNFLKDLNGEISQKILPDFSYWGNEVKTLKSQKISNEKNSDKLHSYEVMKALNDYANNLDTIITTEVGQHQISLVKNFDFNKPNQLLTSGGLGAMGFGLPAAIGAAAALKNIPVICVTGDGSFQMNMQELAVCSEYNLPVKIFIINNGYLGLVRQLQETQCEKRYYETQIANPDFVKLAESFGVASFRVEKQTDLIPAFEKVFNTKGPVVVEFITEPMENV